MNPLEQSILHYQKAGWVLLSRTENAAQLRKPKGNPGCLLVTILLLLGVLPGIIYLLSFAVRKEQVVTLFINNKGQVQKR